jgi:cob(I)alamin adenosyltransferase
MTPTELRQFWLTARHQPAAQGHLARDLAAWPDAQCVTFSTKTEPEVDRTSTRLRVEVVSKPAGSEPEASTK